MSLFSQIVERQANTLTFKALHDRAMGCETASMISKDTFLSSHNKDKQNLKRKRENRKVKDSLIKTDKMQDLPFFRERFSFLFCVCACVSKRLPGIKFTPHINQRRNL